MAAPTLMKAPDDRSVLQVVRDKNARAIGWVWVLHGAAWLAFIAYVWTAWVLSDDFRPNTIGRGQEPTWFVNTVLGLEIVFGVVLTGWIIWHFIVRPKLRTGSFSFDGLFFMGCSLMVFQEPWMNWIQPQFLYATTFVNFGSWLAVTPGWSSPNAELIPVPLVYFAAYLWMVAIAGLLGSRYMRRVRRRRPSIGNAALIARTFALMVVADFVLESVMTRLQLISYPSTVKELTLFAGTDHQFPVYELLSWPGTWIMLACLHFFRDEEGRSVPERQIERLGIRNGRLNMLARFAAIAGACQLTILIAFNLPYQFWGLNADKFPQDLLDRPWRIAGICGPTTAYDCPDPKNPIARDSSPTNRIAEPVSVPAP